MSDLKPLDEAALFELSAGAIAAFLARGERFECERRRGVATILCNEAVADLNIVLAGDGAGESAHYGEACARLAARGLPFVSLVFPSAGADAERAAVDAGLTHVAGMPYMVQQAPVLPAGNEQVRVRPAAGDADARAVATVLGAAFGLDAGATLRAVPAAAFQSPAVDAHVAELDGEVVGALLLTQHGDTAGVWGMGVDTSRQRGGVGRRLLSTAMSEARARGVQRFYLGASPEGEGLYASLGFTTRFAVKAFTVLPEGGASAGA